MNMINEQIIQEVQKYTWKQWLQRPFHAFILSFSGGTTQEYFEKIGVPGVELEATVYQSGSWYESDVVWEKYNACIEIFLKDHSVYEVTEGLEKFLEENKSWLHTNPEPTEENYKKLHSILKSVTTYIWLAHGLEHVFTEKLNAAAKEFATGDLAQFVGDATFPTKKNKHAIMEAWLREGRTAQEIANEFGWLRARDGFENPFTAEQLEEMRVHVGPHKEPTHVEIPEKHKALFDEGKELVYFRTQRTDALFELLFYARPLITALGEKYGIAFKELKNYTFDDLIGGTPNKYESQVTGITYKGESVFSDKPLIGVIENVGTEVKGTIAQKGKATGIVKIVRVVEELGKVNVGDVLVTQMTFPSFIQAMQKAVAFVTDEGGITCHAAIVAREMKKPCIIGTKIATKLLKDGDMVEVDADSGVVRKI